MVADKGMARVLEKAADEGQDMKDWLGRLLRLDLTELRDLEAKGVYAGALMRRSLHLCRRRCDLEDHMSLKKTDLELVKMDPFLCHICQSDLA